MPIINEEDVQRIRSAIKTADEAKKQAYKLIQIFFIPGTVIHWTSRGYPQRGYVRCVIGSSSNPVIRVTNEKTDREVDVPIYFVDFARMKSQAKSFELLKAEIAYHD
jgi:hypothetical protein